MAIPKVMLIDGNILAVLLFYACVKDRNLAICQVVKHKLMVNNNARTAVLKKS